MSFKEKMNDPVYKQMVIGIAVATIFVVTLSLALFSNNSNKSGSKAVSEFTGSNTKAAIVNGDEIYKFIEGVRFLNLRKDLRELSKSQQVENRYLVFNITKVIKKDTNNKSIKFEGKFEDSNLKLSIEIVNKPNQRQKQTVINMSNKKDISSYSPSNSKLNQFIETLPINNTDYYIEYTSTDESITVNLLKRDPNLFSKAKSEIKAAVGDNSYDESKINSLFPPY